MSNKRLSTSHTDKTQNQKNPGTFPFYGFSVFKSEKKSLENYMEKNNSSTLQKIKNLCSIGHKEKNLGLYSCALFQYQKNLTMQ